MRKKKKRIYGVTGFDMSKGAHRRIKRVKTAAPDLATRKRKNPMNLSPPPGRRKARILKPPGPVPLKRLGKDGRTIFGYRRDTNLGRAADFLYNHRQSEHLLARFIMLVYGIGATTDTHLYKARGLLNALSERVKRDGYRVQTASHPRRVGLFKITEKTDG